MRARPSGVGSIEHEDDRRLPFAGRKGPQRHDQILQLQRRAGRCRCRTTRPDGIGDPTFGRTGQHDVLGLGIVEHVAHAGQPGQELHLLGRRLPLVELSSHGRFESIERDLAQLAGLGHVGIQAWPWPRRSASSTIWPPGSAKVLQPQHAVGVDDHAVGAADAAGVVASEPSARCQRPAPRPTASKTNSDERALSNACPRSPQTRRSVPETLPPHESVEEARGGSAALDD